MNMIPGGNTVEVDLRQLRAFEVLLRERNLTRAATVLGVAQPALSKTLAKLRRYFADPLFVRAGHRMEPTAKALELADAVHALLDDATMLRARHRPFDPKTSTRTFSFSVVDSGLVRILPPLLSHLPENHHHQWIGKQKNNKCKRKYRIYARNSLLPLPLPLPLQ